MNLEKNKELLVKLGEKIDSFWIDSQLAWIIEKIQKNIETFGNNFPSACTTKGKYRIKENDDWTNGFWTGMLCLAYEVTRNEKFLNLIEKNLESFQERLNQHFVLDHHDIGFLYSLSAGAAYEITGRESYKHTFIQAANVLLARFQEKGNFIQAWGKYGDLKEYRLIIDSFMNLPLLFKASQLSGNQIYAEIAKRHYQTLLRLIFRKDGSTYHTYYFDPKTGAPIKGVTHQGHSDSSTWARGQAWAVLGIPLNESYVHSQEFPPVYPEVVNVFLENLPEDLIPYWDFDFTDAEPSDKDSSAAAVAACGLLEAEQFRIFPGARELAQGLIYQLGENYSAQESVQSEGLLLHGVYAHAEGKGVDESNLWGDYFYFESLMRLKNPNWKKYW